MGPVVTEYKIDLNTPGIWTRVDSIGRRRQVTLQPGDNPLLIPGLKPRLPHPVYALGYANSVSYEYQLLLIDLFNSVNHPWSEEIQELAGGLEYPYRETRTYEEAVAFQSALAESVNALRPGLPEAVAPFAGRHGLDVLPWGLGWLYQHLPQKSTQARIEVPVALPP